MATFPTAEESTQTALLAGDRSRVAAPKRLGKSKARAIPKKARKSTKAQSVLKRASPRAGSKAAKVLALLKRPQGASLEELLKITGWQPHSIRGFLSGTLTAKMGLKVTSWKAESGERRYAITA